MDAGKQNYIGLLHELAQKKRWTVQFDVVDTAGPDHIKTFTVRAVVNGKKYPEGSGRSIKEAKQNAAKNAYNLLENETVNTETNLNSSASLAAVSQAKFACWVNEHGQKNRLHFTTKETTKIDLSSSIQFHLYTCQYICGDKEFPEATATNKKEANEAAAKLVYESLTEQEKPRVVEENEEENLNIQNLSTSLQNLDLSMLTDTDTTPTGGKNFIGLLNEYCQRNDQIHSFEPVARRGPAHDPEFVYQAVINNKKYPEGRGKTKQEAKQKAAQLAWTELPDSDLSSQGLTLSATSESPDNASYSEKIYRPQSKSEFIVFANSGSEPLDVKPKRQMAPNFQNSPVGNKKQSNINALRTPKALTSPVNTTPTKSRFLTEFDSIVRIGQGGQGRVFQARRKLENTIFAVKIVKFNERSLREVTALSRLENANIVRYHTSWTEETEYRDETPDTYSSSSSDPGLEFLYIQMEFCEGKTLQKWIDERNDYPEKYPVRRQKAAKIIKQVLEAVKYIHSQGLIHRDLKPPNIMFGRDGGVKVGDFGLVTTDEGEDDLDLLERSRKVGTRTYMSPEQKQTNYDRKVDIYPVGLIYLELLWRFGTKSEKQKHWDDIRSGNCPDNFSIKFDFEHKLIKRMLSQKPEGRPEATDLLMELNQHNATAAQKKHDEHKNRTY